MHETRERDGDTAAGAHIDVAVVGAGTAGLAAALMARRHRLDTVVFDGGPPRNAWAREVHAYLGLSGVSGADLKRLGCDQVRAVGGRIEAGEVVHARRKGDGFELETADGRRWRCRAVLLATGVRDSYPEVGRFDEFFGTSVHVCPHCDAYEWRDQPIAVISWNEDTRPYALKFTDWTRDVTVVTDGRRPALEPDEQRELAEHGIALVTATIDRFEGDDGQLTGLRLADGSLLPARAAFFNLGESHANELAHGLGVEIGDDASIVTEEHGRTSVDGVWAAGDITGRDQFASVAAAQGVVAAVDIYRALSAVDEQPEE
jgi:thioredoxin reductase